MWGQGGGGAWDTTRPVSYKKTIHVADVGWGDSAALGGGLCEGTRTLMKTSGWHR